MHLKIVLREWMASTTTNNNSTMRRFHVDALTHSLQNHTMERNSQKVHFFFFANDNLRQQMRCAKSPIF